MKTKHFLFILALAALSLSAKAQGNLQFNQIKVITGVVNNYSASENFTVPENKVWKIEFFTAPNGIIINDQSINPSNNISGFGFGQCPIWLGPSDRVKATCWTATSGAGGFVISIIEFNIVP